ncbi:GLPGLI family protein [Chryseobacterium sp. LC2016-29]|uniref:GLPGLI family protein n=1 Tax=Chryseobacterium sp. LC2016-29 TaxID=2897331 RepID=UPI001E4A071B|nr:GLPGLI family protein [Chryseobacterium sp. LC2016-29]MCD0478430.1 GLPGLI family protein [Chryseobacterium sp. LC2016-29]
MLKVFISILIFCSALISAQQTKILGNFSMKASSYSAKIFEKSNLNIYYQFKFLKDAKISENPREGLCVLQIGENYSKFSDIKTLAKDSLSEKFSNLESVGVKEMNQLFTYNPLWSMESLKSGADKKVTYQKRYKTKYEYEELQPELKWQLHNESKKILDYSCKKATVKYRGREFVAWYTTEVPINNGPYVFEGLPGLILELEDSQNKYHFTAVGIDKKPMDIYLRNDKEILRISRAKFREVEKTYHDNPGAFHGKAVNEDGSPIVVKSKPFLYDPFELE